MGTCTTCGKDFTGGYVKHAIKNHPRKNTTRENNPTPTGVTGGDLEITWGAVGTPEQDLATHAGERLVPTHVVPAVSTSAVRGRKGSSTQVARGPRTPVVSAKTARTDARNAIPARERALRAELRQARRAMRRIEAQLVDVRS
jgi:hypothetical protein